MLFNQKTFFLINKWRLFTPVSLKILLFLQHPACMLTSSHSIPITSSPHLLMEIPGSLNFFLMFFSTFPSSPYSYSFVTVTRDTYKWSYLVGTKEVIFPIFSLIHSSLSKTTLCPVGACLQEPFLALYKSFLWILPLGGCKSKSPKLFPTCPQTFLLAPFFLCATQQTAEAFPTKDSTAITLFKDPQYETATKEQKMHPRKTETRYLYHKTLQTYLIQMCKYKHKNTNMKAKTTCVFLKPVIYENRTCEIQLRWCPR